MEGSVDGVFSLLLSNVNCDRDDDDDGDNWLENGKEFAFYSESAASAPIGITIAAVLLICVSHGNQPCRS